MIQGILLAAGTSSRFGGDKLLALLPDGTPVAVASARSLLQGVDSVLAVVRQAQDELAVRLNREGVQTVGFPADGQGMGDSLKTGVAAAENATGWIIALADMPFISPLTVHAVAERLRKGAGIAVPYYRGRRGHPVGFGNQYREQLLALGGDRGAIDVLEKYAVDVDKVICDDAAIHADIDLPADLAWAPD